MLLQAFTAMNQLRKSEKLCDIRILAENSEFLAHKVVLASLSPYFEVSLVAVLYNTWRQDHCIWF